MDDPTEQDQSTPEANDQNPIKEAVGDAPAPVPVNSPPQAVVSHHGGSDRKSWLKYFIILLVVAVAVSVGWGLYQNHKDKQNAAKTASQNKDIPLLRIGTFSADYGNVYPDMSANDYGISVNAQMFEGLVRYENKSKIVPELATDWTNPDNNTWVFTIEKGIKFHDGHTLASSDVKYSLDKAVASDSDLDQTFASTIASVDLVGKDQVKITTKSPDPTLLNKLTFLYVIDANLPKSDEPSQAGTGPYEIKPGTKPTNKNYQMVAYDGYHGGRPTTRALTFGSQNDNSALVKAFNAGQFDIAGSLAPDSIKQAKNATIFDVDEANSTFIGFNTVKPGPAQNKLVREAIRYAVNAKAIGKSNDVVITPVSQLIPPSIPGYNPAIAPYKQNIAKAKQLMAQAGYPNGTTITLSGSEANADEVAEIASELKPIGITVKLDKHTDFDEFINYFSTGQAEMYVIDYASDTLDGVDIFTTTLPTDNYNNPKVAQLLDQANMTVNPATRLKLLQQVSSVVDQDVAVVPLGSTSAPWVMNKDYAIQQDTPTGYIPVYFYKVHLK
jgi:peptide/nickel transport system substrate-binding protein